jgi:hypothetical protein
MHGPPTAATATITSAEELGHDGARGNSTREGVSMLTVGCDDGVLCLEGLHHTDRDRLFADIEMEEAANLLSRVEFCASLFEAADPHHLLQQCERVFAARPFW